MWTTTTGPELVKTKEDFSLDLWAIEEAITEKTKAILINTPNNPTAAFTTRRPYGPWRPFWKTRERS